MTDEAMSEMSARRRFGLGGVPAQFGLVIIIAAFWTVFAWRAPGFLSPFISSPSDGRLRSTS